MTRITPNQKPAAGNAVEAAVVAAALIASAAVVVWQNSRLTVLWDLSYILENATRMAAGQRPYRDFPFPYAPLTFEIQALIIRIFGRAAWHHALYAAIAGGLATALAYRIVRRFVGRFTATALLLPLVPLGIYAILPHPFYDPDACLLVLALMVALLETESPRARFAIGVASVLTLFVKQNIGLAFVVALAALSIVARDRRRSVPLLAGMACGTAMAVALVSALFGMGNYVQWTMRFAASRRLPSFAQYAGIYSDDVVWWWVAWAVAGAVVLLFGVRRPQSPLSCGTDASAGAREDEGTDKSVCATSGGEESKTATTIAALRVLGAALISVPFLWTIYRIVVTDDPDEREVNLLRFWPMLIICGVMAGIVWLWRERGPRAIVPLLAIATIAGAFLSQSDWGSTYGIWPMLIVIAAACLSLACRGDGRIEAVLAVVVSAALLSGGIPYLIDSERLTYVKLEGDLQHSSLPPLRGLSEAGPWLPEFEQLVAWTNAHIPREDGILSLPGEDLFYFTTGRTPRFPVLMFDRTVNPYDAATIARLADEKRIRWVIVKKRLQLNGTPMTDYAEAMRLLAPRLRVAVDLPNYTIYGMRPQP